MDEVAATLGQRDDAVVDGRLDDLAQTLDVLRGQITDVAALVGPDDASAERLLAIEARLDRVALADDEIRALSGRLQSLESHTTDDLTRRFDVLEARLADGLVHVFPLPRFQQGYPQP